MSMFCLEIGSEEIPARFLPILESELLKNATKELNDNAISFDKIEVFTTARRTILLVHNIASKSAFKEEEVLGPAKNIAYDSTGQPSKALEGFMRGHNLKLADLYAKESAKGQYMAALKKSGGQESIELLSIICPKLIKATNFPKRMRWGAETLQYARPLRWILALFDDKIVNFSLSSKISSSNLTHGHRILGAGPFLVHNAQDLLDILQKQGKIICSLTDRKIEIITKANELAKQVQGKVIWVESLLDEVCGLTEYPIPVLGEFSADYLEIPKEVLLTSMQSHQKSFGIEDSNGQLLPYFLTVSNILSEEPDLVKKGWQRVLKARLEDASFFWKSDLKHSFNEWLEKLDKVSFLGPLGSMGDKTKRLEKLCNYLACEVQSKHSDLASRAGRLSKADLVSEMVNEFDTLQGIMGSIYAYKFQENELVAKAISEQYLPSGPESDVPQTELGSILAIADKLDTLVACFGLNNIPTGAADPYALRRCALGIIRICLEKSYTFELKAIIKHSFALYSPYINWKLSEDELVQKLYDFLMTRLKNYYQTIGFDVLHIEAVLNIEHNNLPSTLHKLQALQKFSQNSNFNTVVLSCKRVANILRKQKDHCVGIWQDSLLQEDAEKNLALKLQEFAKKFENADYNYKYELLAELCPSIDNFFEKTMIMAEDEQLRQNRIELLNYIFKYFNLLADFNALQL